MEGIPKEAWIIIYIWDSPEDWVGGYPSNLWQQMKTQNGTTPEHFDTYEDAKKCAEVDGLYNYRIIPVAGAVAKKFYTGESNCTLCGVINF